MTNHATRSDKEVRVTFVLPQELVDALDALARRTDRNRSQLLRRVVSQTIPELVEEQETERDARLATERMRTAKDHDFIAWSEIRYRFLDGDPAPRRPKDTREPRR